LAKKTMMKRLKHNAGLKRRTNREGSNRKLISPQIRMQAVRF